MPRSSCTGVLIFDLEIEKTTKTNRKVKKQEDNLLSSMPLSMILKVKKKWPLKRRKW